MDGKLTADAVLQGVLSSQAGVITGAIASRGEVLLGAMSKSGGVWDYNDLQNLPALNGVIFQGNKVSEDYYLPKVMFNSTDEWAQQTTLISEKNVIYVYTDYKQTEDNYYIAGIKVGDGLAYVVDLPFIDTLMEQHMADSTIHVTPEEKEFWNNKNRAIEVNENLILTIY